LKGEARRLSASHERDWNLVGEDYSASTRTRGSTRSIPEGGVTETLVVPEIVLLQDEEQATAMSSPGMTTASSSTGEETPEATVPVKKPTHMRVILEVSQLEQAFQRMKCLECYDELELNLWTVCIATNIELVCNNKDCSYICDFARPSPTSMHADGGDKYERVTDFAVNVLYVLGCILVGDAHTEAGRLLGLLGLPNDTTMMNRSFGIIEECIGPFIRRLCDEIIAENLELDAKFSMNEIDFNIWKMWKNDASLGVMPTDRMPQINALYGNRRDLATFIIHSQDTAVFLVCTLANHWVGDQEQALLPLY
jgi:hypothetical protein